MLFWHFTKHSNTSVNVLVPELFSEWRDTQGRRFRQILAISVHRHGVGEKLTPPLLEVILLKHNPFTAKHVKHASTW